MATESDTKIPKQDVVEGINLLAQGKRNLLCGEVHQAVNQLEEAARIFSKEYGELANECADVYLLYGQALLELHRSESNVFENGLQSDSSDDDNEEEDEDDNDGEDEEEEEGNDKEDKVSDRESDGSEDLIEEELSGDAKKDDNTEHCQTGSSTDSDKKCDVDKNEKTIKDEDVSNLQLSWETLEIAKLIYSRQEGSEVRLKLADAYSKLGDVGLEMEQFDEAIKDYEECLNIQKSILAEDSRRIAETLYQLGIAHNLHKSYASSCNCFKASIQVMENRKNRLKKVVDGEIPPDTKDGGDGFYTPVELAAKEVNELTELINEVQAKIEEVEDERKSAPNVSKLLKESLTSTGYAQTNVGSADHCSNSAKASASVHVITHLLRKKKASPGTSEDEAKKQKLENVDSSNIFYS